MLCVLFFKKSLLKGKKKAQEEGGSLEYKDFFFFSFLTYLNYLVRIIWGIIKASLLLLNIKINAWWLKKE